MAVSIPNNQIAQFDADVKQAYQSGSKLRGTVRVKTGVIGITHQFPTFGKGIATPRIYQTDVVPMNVQQDHVNATLEPWNAPEYTDKLAQLLINYSERAELATTIAMAIGRREDQIILDSLVGEAANTVPVGIGPSNAMNVTKIRRAARFLNDVAAPKGDRHIYWSPIAEEQLLGSTQVTSIDYNGVRALVNGEVNTFMGFQFHMIETRDEGGLPLTGDIRTCYALHGNQRGSVGIAIGQDFMLDVGWVREKTSWLSNGLFSAGAVVIDPNGVVEMPVDEGVTVSNAQ